MTRNNRSASDILGSVQLALRQADIGDAVSADVVMVVRQYFEREYL